MILDSDYRNWQRQQNEARDSALARRTREALASYDRLQLEDGDEEAPEDVD